MKKHLHALSAVATATLLLVSCGGGSADPAPDAVLAGSSSASFAECFELTPGVQYSMSTAAQYTVVERVFDGALEPGLSNDQGAAEEGTYVDFIRVSDGFIRFLGDADYDKNGDLIVMWRTSEFKLRDNMQPGESAEINYVEEFTSIDPPMNSSENESINITFEGFEDLTLAGQTFSDTCRLSATRPETPGQTSVVWFAKGFGPIRTEFRRLGDVTETEELNAVLATP